MTKNVIPYIPDRFSEGYGINPQSISKLKSQYPNLGLIITVDNGIVANEAVDKANDLGVDVIITDHHQKDKKKPKAHSIIHTDKISGSAIAWVTALEILKKLKRNSKIKSADTLELAGIGTISDQLPLVEINRAFAKWGLQALNATERVGLLALFEEAGIKTGTIGTYEINFVIAPRINAMGRMEHAIDSLRLICTKSKLRAQELAQHIGKINRERQKVVEEVVEQAKEVVRKVTWRGPIFLAHKSFHEGVIGLAASKLVEEFYRPSVVVSVGEEYSKASARSISGFNIIQVIRKLDSLIVGGGGHPMAAGFTIKTDQIKTFSQRFEELSSPLLTEELLTKRLKIDTHLEFEDLSLELVNALSKFEPLGIGNPAPTFATRKVRVKAVRTVGIGGKHLKLELEKKGKVFSGIGFGKGTLSQKLFSDKAIDIAYNIERDTWNNNDRLQLKIKDIHFHS